MLVKKDKGFTLVEILVVMAILLIMIMILIGILNPIALVNKARDSRRKKDLRRIKVAFEEYYNDKGCYPNQSIVDGLMQKSYCGGSSIFGRWLKPWPCDPNGNSYEIQVGYDQNCPKWFRILTILENKNDMAINMAGVLATDPNYAVSSDNIPVNFYPGDNNPSCESNCYVVVDEGLTCNSRNFSMGCEAPNCYRNPDCTPECQTSCCGAGCP